jgi:uncharacterized damage-inducible protein DinB
MTLSEMLLLEFDEETAKTRNILERVPDEHTSWRPHAKSMTLGRLATHLAEIPRKCSDILAHDSYDMAPGGAPPVPRSLASHAEIVELFDANVRANRPLVEAADDAALAARWSFMRAGHVLFAMPRSAALRRIFFSHTVHHRGQLTVYLRLHDVPLPATYGPSADEAI